MSTDFFIITLCCSIYTKEGGPKRKIGKVRIFVVFICVNFEISYVQYRGSHVYSIPPFLCCSKENPVVISR